MVKNGQPLNKKDYDPFFIDKWCARTIRKVRWCAECLHYYECKQKGASVAPSAIAHALNKKKSKDDDVG